MPALLVRMTAHVVAAQVTATPTRREDIPALVRMVHRELASIGGPGSEVGGRPTMPEEATQEGQIDPLRWPGVFEDRIVCLEDGLGVTLLKSHLGRRHRMSVAEYIRKWRLPSDYPTIPRSYARRKRDAAIDAGLGTKVRANKEKGGPRG